MKKLQFQRQWDQAENMLCNIWCLIDVELKIIVLTPEQLNNVATINVSRSMEWAISEQISVKRRQSSLCNSGCRSALQLRSTSCIILVIRIWHGLISHSDLRMYWKKIMVDAKQRYVYRSVTQAIIENKFKTLADWVSECFLSIK